MWDEHGDFSIKVKDRVLFVRVQESINEITMKRFVEAYKAAAGTLGKNEPWGCLVDLRDWQLNNPDTDPMMAALHEWCVANRQQYEATLVDHSVVKARLVQKYLAGTVGAIEHKSFAKETEALAWLASKGVVSCP